MADAIVNGARLHHQRAGVNGSPVRVVFVHGLVMDNLASWYFTVASAVSAFADVLLYDLRGHGRSEQTEGGYGVDGMVADLVGLLDATLGCGPVCVVGNSFGALVAVTLARHFPERVAATLSLRGAEADRAIAESFRDWVGRHSERKRTRLGERARALVERTSLVRDLRATEPLDAEDFARIAAPTLALYGERSDVLERSAPLLACMPHCTLEIVPGCTHSILWEATDRVRARTVEFCRSLAPSAAPDREAVHA
jgi:pimeloyl-ACP methyl ester carboxylesterase